MNKGQGSNVVAECNAFYCVITAANVWKQATQDRVNDVRGFCAHSHTAFCCKYSHHPFSLQHFLAITMSQWGQTPYQYPMQTGYPGSNPQFQQNHQFQQQQQQQNPGDELKNPLG